MALSRASAVPSFPQTSAPVGASSAASAVGKDGQSEGAGGAILVFTGGRAQRLAKGPVGNWGVPATMLVPFFVT